MLILSASLAKQGIRLGRGFIKSVSAPLDWFVTVLLAIKRNIPLSSLGVRGFPRPTRATAINLSFASLDFALAPGSPECQGMAKPWMKKWIAATDQVSHHVFFFVFSHILSVANLQYQNSRNLDFHLFPCNLTNPAIFTETSIEYDHSLCFHLLESPDSNPKRVNVFGTLVHYLVWRG